jgi:four helix bundle protein
MSSRLQHENLIVYQDAIAFVGRASAMGESIPSKRSVKEQLLRAAESVPLNIAVGNAGQGSAGQLQSIEFASASVAECAACMDVISRMQLADSKACDTEKSILLRSFRMLAGLRRHWESRLQENEEVYGEPCFAHERLECYRLGLEMVTWGMRFGESHDLPTRNADAMDRSSTGFVLNLAEGNARFSPKDRARLLDVAVMHAFRFAATLDIVVARNMAVPDEVSKGKDLATVSASQALGLRRKELEC